MPRGWFAELVRSFFTTLRVEGLGFRGQGIGFRV